MTALTVDEPVRIVDNGVRSFIPPTFCFELRGPDDELMATVSRVAAADGSLQDFDALGALERRRTRATGTITDYDAGAEARRRGWLFTIERVVDEHGNESTLS